jgi:hypothetical protein
VSSAILYAAIVAIWIGVLVPRWLRHDHTRDSHVRLRRFSSQLGPQADPGDADARVFSQDGRPRYTSFGGPGTAQPGQNAARDAARAGQPGPDEAESSQRDPRPERPPAEHDGSMEPAGDRRGERHERPRRPPDGDQAVPPSGARPGTTDSERRAQVVRGRRRMLWMLLILTAIAAGLAYLGLAAWWIVVPPAVVLFGYLLLLREAAHADAEARERAAALARRTREAEAQRARESAAQRAADARREQARRAAQAGTPPGGSAPIWTAHEMLSHAEIIDISERVGDQLYDQYADAKLRAVGD